MRPTVILAFCLTLAPAFAATPRVFLLDAKQLATVRQRLDAGDTNTTSALASFQRRADQALTNGPFSVVDKEITPPSGDKHDYMSVGPYWWPDPASSNGLPYIRRDGETNPERYKIPDHDNLTRMTSTVRTLALAWYFTADERYAARATLLLRTWFLNPATRMNPNLEFGQAIPGITPGRGIGIIDTSSFPSVVDALGLLANSTSWTAADQQGMQQWFNRYLDWMLNSKCGREEAAAKNNHGTYYDMQVASIALFIGNTNLARQTLQTAAQKRIATQVEPDGRQPLELERTNPWGYSSMNLRGLMNLATLGQHVGVDLWLFETPDGRSIRKALDYMLPFAAGEKQWTHPEIRASNRGGLGRLVALATQHYPDAGYEAWLKKLPARNRPGDDALLSLQPDPD